MALASFDDIPPLAPAPPEEPQEPHGVHVVVETPMGSRNKFAVSHDFGLIELSRTLNAGNSWPCDFGFVPQTLGEDGDALDVCLLIDAPTFPGCLVRARLLGVIGLVKNGEQNDRLLACPARKKGSGSAWDEFTEAGQLPARRLRELEAFLRDYNTFEGHSIELTGWRDAASAMAAVHAAMARWSE